MLLKYRLAGVVHLTKTLEPGRGRAVMLSKLYITTLVDKLWTPDMNSRVMSVVVLPSGSPFSANSCRVRHLSAVEVGHESGGVGPDKVGSVHRL